MSADVAPMAFRAVQASADTAFVANKNLAVGFPNRTHVTYSVSFVILASLDLGRSGASEISRLHGLRRAKEDGGRLHSTLLHAVSTVRT